MKSKNDYADSEVVVVVVPFLCRLDSWVELAVVVREVDSVVVVWPTLTLIQIVVRMRYKLAIYIL